MSSLNETPRANRIHIGIFGRRNSGKSSLINALAGQDTALVSEAPGTTTDPVYKSMELHPVGPVVFIDTAGFDDEGALGSMRVERTEDVIRKTDIAIMVIDGSRETEDDFEYERRWLDVMALREIPLIIAFNKSDMAGGTRIDDMERHRRESLAKHNGISDTVDVSAVCGSGMDHLREAIKRAVSEDVMRERILGDMVEAGSLVLLVMPQDIQAPKGRLILPQVQTLRELLDRKCTAVATTADGLDNALEALNRDPDLIITDSQCFKMVYDKKPEKSALTSFSVLFAAYKGDIDKFMDGASLLDEMTENSRVLIAEACTHVPLSEDIGREKIPAILRKRFGEDIEIVNVCGNDFPAIDELEGFDLVIHCGACMFNRRHVLTRIAEAEAAGTGITNYGVFLAKMSGILDKITLPG